ncbi:MAG: hypothetical protein LDL31_00990 [Prosthecobacter sp.]|jgi:hypothetical protein|nr:hypothetical protein [Prosthecobacter sp.]
MQFLLHPSDRPVFRLSGVVSQCRLELRIHDVPIHQDTSGKTHHFDLAINEWLFQGGNVIEVRLAPLQASHEFAPSAFLEMTLHHKSAHDEAGKLSTLGNLTWRPQPSARAQDTRSQALDTDTLRSTPPPPPQTPEETALLALPGQADDLRWTLGAPVLQPDHSVHLLSRLPLPPPWPACPWLRGALLTDLEEPAQTIGICLRTLHAALRADAWQPLLETRRAAIQAAYGLGEPETDEALGFPSLLHSPGWQLVALPAGLPRLEIAGKGRLARMIDPATGLSPLLLRNPTLGLLAEIQAWWMFTGKWILVR